MKNSFKKMFLIQNCFSWKNVSNGKMFLMENNFLWKTLQLENCF